MQEEPESLQDAETKNEIKPRRRNSHGKENQDSGSDEKGRNDKRGNENRLRWGNTHPSQARLKPDRRHTHQSQAGNSAHSDSQAACSARPGSVAEPVQLDRVAWHLVTLTAFRTSLPTPPKQPGNPWLLRGALFFTSSLTTMRPFSYIFTAWRKLFSPGSHSCTSQSHTIRIRHVSQPAPKE